MIKQILSMKLFKISTTKFLSLIIHLIIFLLSFLGPTTPLLNVTIIQRGFYFARVVVNFLRNGLQDEFETGSTFDGTNRVFRLQKSAADVITYLRIRFHVVGSHKDFGDFQVIHPDGEKLCFVLSGTAFSPVYSICAPDEDYSRK